MSTYDLSHCTAHPGKVVDLFYGKEDHGVLTCCVTCEGDWGGQGFGTLVLDERTGPAFKREVAAAFGLTDFEALKGQPCTLYRSKYTEMAEAIGGPLGVFSIADFQRRMWPDKPVLPAKDAHLVTLRRRREGLLRQAADLQEQIDKLTKEETP